MIEQHLVLTIDVTDQSPSTERQRAARVIAAFYGYEMAPRSLHETPIERFVIAGSVQVDGSPGKMVTVYLNPAHNPTPWRGVPDYLMCEATVAKRIETLSASPQLMRPGGPVVQDIHAAEVSLTRVNIRPTATR